MSVLTEEDIFCVCQILYTDYNKRGDAKMYVKDVVNQDYRKWKRGDCVFVEAPCLVYNKNTPNCRGDSPKLQREIPQ